MQSFQLFKWEKNLIPKDILIDIKGISKKAQEYFFLSKNATIEKKREIFKKLHQYVKKELKRGIRYLENTDMKNISLPWNIAQSCAFIKKHAWRYLLDVGHFVRTQTIKKGKLLSLHLTAVACISKGKLDKKYEFGRQIQLGRIGGNFLIPLSTEIKMEDKKSLVLMAENHKKLFGQNRLHEIGTDKGYYSSEQIKTISAMGINTDGVQRPVNVKSKPPSGNRTPYRSCEEFWPTKKQNEIGHRNTRVSVYVYNGFQSSPIDEEIRLKTNKITKRKLERIGNRNNKEISERMEKLCYS